MTTHIASVDCKDGQLPPLSTAFNELARLTDLPPYHEFIKDKDKVDGRLATVGHTFLRVFGSDLSYEELFRIIIKGSEIPNWVSLKPHDKETLINLGAYLPVGLREEADFRQISNLLVEAVAHRLKNSALSEEVKEDLKAALAEKLSDISLDLPLNNGVKEAYLPGLGALYAEQELYSIIGWRILDRENRAVRPNSTKKMTEKRAELIESLIRSVPDLRIETEKHRSFYIAKEDLWQVTIAKEMIRSGDNRRHLIFFREKGVKDRQQVTELPLEDVSFAVPSESRKLSNLGKLFDRKNFNNSDADNAFILEDSGMSIHRDLACGTSDLKRSLEIHPYYYALSMARIDLSAEPVAVMRDSERAEVIYFQYPVFSDAMKREDLFFTIKVDEAANNVSSYLAPELCVNHRPEETQDPEPKGMPATGKAADLISLKQYFNSRKKLQAS